ncbi:MAG: hypothetical protein ACKV0T_16975 [Planctomycetales bacterium]
MLARTSTLVVAGVFAWGMLLFPLSVGSSIVARGAAKPLSKPPEKELLSLPLLFHDDFADGAKRWEPSDPQAWKVVEQDRDGVYSQFQQSDVKTSVRSPFNRALVKELVVGDFVLDVRLRSTKADYPHRDLCLFFGFQDPSHLYYVHFGKQTDDHANQIFIVNNEPRRKISTQTSTGTNWTDDWHHARIVRRVASGSIEVFFDNMEKPVMKAVDETFTWGQVGVGSFDDTGDFDDILLYGRRVEPMPKATP